MGGDPVVSIVIPVLDPGPLLERCIGAIGHDGPPTEIVVVDNGSTEREPLVKIARGPSISVLRNEINLGFATACNQGARAARGSFVLFLNVDATLPHGALRRLVTVAVKDEAAALWQPLILSPDGTPENAGELMSPAGISVRIRRPADVEPYGVFSCTAACLLVRRHAFFELGGFREGFFAYAEDVDLCWRARLAGWEARVVPDVTVIHVQNVTANRIFTVDQFRYLTFRNRFRSLLANTSACSLLRMAPLFLGVAFTAAVGQLVMGRWRSALAIMRALAWPVTHAGEVASHRRLARAVRTRSDREVFRRELTAPLGSALLRRQVVEHLGR